jgi:hypothetical protein
MDAASIAADLAERLRGDLRVARSGPWVVIGAKRHKLLHIGPMGPEAANAFNTVFMSGQLDTACAEDENGLQIALRTWGLLT